MQIIERNLQEIGKSLLVTLPKTWTMGLKLKKGSSIKMVVSEQGNLLIAPEFTKQEITREATIIFDQDFRRKFFREYFNGNEKISILLKEISEPNRKVVYSFLKKFMNVQIIEETNNKLVVKCFRIEDLSMEECLKRMYFLTVNMMDEVLNSNEGLRLNEMEESLTKFYYMLVMQIRIFLTEGKFTTNNKISLIEALDYRMVGEKLERIADIIIKIKLNENNKKMLVEIKDYFSRSFNNFIIKNYDKSIGMLNEERDIKVRFEKLIVLSTKEKNIDAYKSTEDLITVLRYAKEISMLVR